MRSKITDVLSVLAAALVPQGDWNDFLGFLESCTSSSEAGIRVSAMNMFR